MVLAPITPLQSPHGMHEAKEGQVHYPLKEHWNKDPTHTARLTMHSKVGLSLHTSYLVMLSYSRTPIAMPIHMPSPNINGAGGHSVMSISLS